MSPALDLVSLPTSEPAAALRPRCSSGYGIPASTFGAAERALAQKGKSFHWARHFLSPTHSRRTTQLYGFCRRIDDIADEAGSGDGSQAALGRIDDDLQAGVTGDPFTMDAIRLFQDCDIPIEIPRLLVAGVTSDLAPVGMATEAELLRYCYRVAGTVGLMMCATLDVTDPLALPHAIDLGIAMQLTNLCRDVAEDAVAGRRYLPASLVGAIDPGRLVQPTRQDFDRAQAAIVTLLNRADEYYASGEAGLHYLPAHARYAILVAGRIYRSIGARLRRRRFEAWATRAMVPGPAKAAISAMALLSPPPRDHTRAHDARLHAALIGFPGIDRAAEVRHD